MSPVSALFFEKPIPLAPGGAVASLYIGFARAALTSLALRYPAKPRLTKRSSSAELNP
jgi:hypothetical protein